MCEGASGSFQNYSKTCVNQPVSKRSYNVFQDLLCYCRSKVMQNAPRGAFFAIRLTFIKLRFVIKIFVCLFFEWPFYTGVTVQC